MGDQLYLERFVWFDNEVRRERFPNANKLGEHFEIAPKTAQRSIDHFRNRLLAPLEYESSKKGYYYTDPTFQLPVIRVDDPDSNIGIENMYYMNKWFRQLAAESRRSADCL